MLKYLLAATLIVLLPLSAHAKMYKWVDENGQTIYSQTPPAGQAVEIIKAAPPPPPSSNQSPTNDLLQRAADLQEDRELAKQKAAKQKQEAQQNKANCEAARHNMSGLNGPPNRLYRLNGEYTRLTPEQRVSEKEKMQKNIKKFCK
ncbi:MAG: DUF4124 domain-containing protein [gamma proteobacterium symbiont of Bathyaustriella thionipta]|nr:DUF4124 domain-containing protein [gamma proteobacterium symbiont of Bathyaustriella thionipta]